MRAHRKILLGVVLPVGLMTAFSVSPQVSAAPGEVLYPHADSNVFLGRDVSVFIRTPDRMADELSVELVRDDILVRRLDNVAVPRELTELRAVCAGEPCEQKTYTYFDYAEYQLTQSADPSSLEQLSMVFGFFSFEDLPFQTDYYRAVDGPLQSVDTLRKLLNFDYQTCDDVDGSRDAACVFTSGVEFKIAIPENLPTGDGYALNFRDAADPERDIWSTLTFSVTDNGPVQILDSQSIKLSEGGESQILRLKFARKLPENQQFYLVHDDSATTVTRGVPFKKVCFDDGCISQPADSGELAEDFSLYLPRAAEPVFSSFNYADARAWDEEFTIEISGVDDSLAEGDKPSVMRIYTDSAGSSTATVNLLVDPASPELEIVTVDDESASPVRRQAFTYPLEVDTWDVVPRGTGVPGATEATDVLTFEFTEDTGVRDMGLVLRGWDIDALNETVITVNGTKIGRLTPGGDDAVTPKLILFMHRDDLILGVNRIVITQKTPGETWGVTGIRVRDFSTESIPLELNQLNKTVYGYEYGESANLGLVRMLFDGVGTDLTLKTIAHDIDGHQEVEVLVNGESLGYLGESPDGGTERTFTLIPESVQRVGENVLEYRQRRTMKEPWGVSRIKLTQ